MFPVLFDHHQEALHIQQLVYFVRIVGVGWVLTGLVMKYTPNLVSASQQNMSKN
jgi:hypothetical protein